MAVPKTVLTYPLNGSLKDFTIPFEYLARKFVTVTLIGTTRQVLVASTDYRFSAKTLITLTRAWGPADGFDNIEIRRITSATERLVDYNDGSILRAYDLNTSQIQAIHIAEEGRDLTADTIGIDASGNLDARGRRIINVADPTDIGDAVSRRYMLAYVSAALAGDVEDLGFVQVGAGAVRRTLQNKLREVVSITDYLAQGGGLTDCSDALIKAGAATSGSVLVPSGDYSATVTPANAVAIMELLTRLRVDGTLALNLTAGSFNFTSPVRVFSSGLKVGALKIVGAPPIAMSITGQVAVSGSAGNYSVTLSVSTAVGVAVGDYLHTYQVAGTGTPEVHRGVWEITGVDSGNSRVTVRNTCRKATFPENAITSSSTVALKTILKFDSCDAFVVVGSRIDFINNLAVVGNADTYWSSANVTGTEKGTHGLIIGALTVAVNGKLDVANPYGVSAGHVSAGPNFGVSGFDQQGIVTELGGTFWGDFVSSCSNKRRGFYASTASGIRAKHISANGNFLDGVISDIGGNVYSSSVSCAVGNGGRGVSASQNGTIIFDTGIMAHNGSDGGGAVLGGMLQATSARFDYNGASGVDGTYTGILVVNNSSMTGNTLYGINAEAASVARANSCTINTNGSNGIRATEGGMVICTGTAFSGNLSDKSVRKGMILDGSTYTYADETAISYTSLPSNTGKGAGFASTSSGDDFIIRHDTIGSGALANSFHFRAGTGGMYANTDNNVILGRASERWSTVFAGTGTISTSDAREKTPVRELTNNELLAAMALSRAVGAFQWLKSVEDKGSDARFHIGLTVQRAMAIMEEHGLDPFGYGFICHDAWDARPEISELNKEGNIEIIQEALPAGDRYGFREGQLAFFLAAGFEQRIKILEGSE